MPPETFLEGRITLLEGDCIASMAELAESSVDACVTDPPYHLTSIVKRFAKTSMTGGSKIEQDAGANATAFGRGARGFMGKSWDGGDVAFQLETWGAVLRVLKPGAHLVAFGAPKNAHRLACAIEDAGFEVRDTIAWLFGSGFPKSHNAGNGWGTALKPAYEPIILARKPLIGTVAENVRRYGTGAINIDGCRVRFAGDTDANESKDKNRHGDFETGPRQNAIYGKDERNRGNYDPPGRWPANVVHDGSDEVIGAFPSTAPAKAGKRNAPKTGGTFGDYAGDDAERLGHSDNGGSAARFFYSAKASKADRAGSKHPTVKPLDLMQWLVRLVTPPGGLVLDPFAGTGTTAEAAWREGMRTMLCEREPEYQKDIRRRMALCLSGPDERARESIKAKQAGKPEDHGPLFGPKVAI